MAVFVLDRSGKPLMPCTEKRARKLLAAGRARVHRVLPFVIRLVDRRFEDCALQTLRVKIDPGSKTTGIALVREAESVDVVSGEVRRELFVLNLFELVHRGRQISEALTGRRAFRRRRRSANLRYRAPRFLNRSRNKRELAGERINPNELAGERSSKWLAPSLRHRIETTLTWVRRFQRWAPVTALSQELVRFDMQKMENAEITGVEYQQGTLAGYELREYLLEKFNRTCCYCDAKEMPLNIEHIHPKAQGGTNRVANLAIACISCNTKKGARSIEAFLAKDPARLARIRAQLKRPLKDAAAVNATRWALFEALKSTGLHVEVGSGGLTKFNRSALDVPKAHVLDAACVGQVDALHDWKRPVLQIKCTGRGSYQRTRLTQYGFARGYLMRTKSVNGFRTGDWVRASVTAGKKIGEYAGRVAVRASGSFNIQTKAAVVQGISHKYCRIIQRGDGYGYVWSI